jgi:hypothetical protein
MIPATLVFLPQKRVLGGLVVTALNTSIAHSQDLTDWRYPTTP